jgi:hypothetical protein
MKKTLLSLASVALSMTAFGQAVPSPFWNIIQNTNFTVTSAGIRHMDAVTDSVVWASGYHGVSGQTSRNYNWVTVTNDAGTTFTVNNAYADTNTYIMANIDGISGTTAWVSSYLKASQNKGAIHQTTNSGMTWTNMTATGMYTNAAAFTNIVAFLSPSVGITMGDPNGTGNEFEIWRTTDGGMNWSKVPGASIPNPSSASEYGLVNVYTKLQGDPNHLWFGTNLGRIYHTTDGGQTWSVGSTGAPNDVVEIAFTDAMNGLAYAYTGTGAGATFGLYQTTNGGSSWTQISPVDPNLGMNDISAIPGTSWFASCSASQTTPIISYSTDHGMTWNSWGGSMIQYLTIDFVSPTVGWAGSFTDPTITGVGGIFKYSGAPLGVANNSSKPVAVDVYPNPNNGIVNINLLASKHGASITVVNMLGEVIYSENIVTASFEKHTINLSHLAKGIYNVNIVRDGEKGTQKIVIQ